MSDNRNEQPTIPSYEQRHDDNEIDLIQLAIDLLSHFRVILLCILASAVLFLGFTLAFVRPKYTATSQLIVHGVSDKTSVVNIMKSSAIFDELISTLNLEYTHDELDEMIVITATSSSSTIVIDVTAENKYTATDIANGVLNLSIQAIPKVLNLSTPPSAIDSATLPTKHSSPNYTRNTIIGALLGAFGSAAFYCVKFIVKDYMVTSDDIITNLGVEPLAVIPKESHKRSLRKSRAKSKDGEEKSR